MEKVIIVDISKSKFLRANPQWQYNHGQKLQFVGVELPPYYEVHFSNSINGEAKKQLGDSSGVLIPFEYFQPGKSIYAWIYITDSDSGITQRQVEIPIHKKAICTDEEPTPEQSDIIEEAIGALNSALDEVDDRIEAALDSAKQSGEFDGTDGTTIWTTSQAPTYPNYTFIIADLAGTPGAVPKEKDLIFYDLKYYKIINVGETSVLSSLYADVKDNNVLHKTGDEMLGALSMGANKITNLANGTNNYDAVNLRQVKQMIADEGSTYRGSFNTKAALLAAPWQNVDKELPYYVDNKDFAIVQADESNNNECWRYMYTTGTGWGEQYKINDAPLSQAQIDALNSGITNVKVQKLDTVEPSAEVNIIEEIRVKNPITEQWAALPVTNKGVNLPEVPIQKEVYYPTFTVDELGDELVVTSSSNTPSEIIGIAALNKKVIIAKVSYNGNVFYLPLSEAQEDQVPWTCSFAGEIDEGLFLRIQNDELSWVVSMFTAAGNEAMEIALSDLSDAIDDKYSKPSGGIPASDLAEGVIPEVHNIPSGGSIGQALIKNSDENYDAIWSDIDSELPDVNSTDYGKVLTVSNDGIWNAQQPIFMVTITNNNNVFSANKTFSEITNAARHNMMVVATYANAYYQYCGIGGGVAVRQFVHIFTRDKVQTIKLFSVNISNVWTQYQYQLGTYSKPDSGIPASDLASAVQTSLGKADTALQEHQSLAAYRTSQAQDEIDRQQNTAIAAKYTKPSGGIPNSDLAEDAQRGYTSEERVTLVPEGTYTFVADGSGYAGYCDLALEEVPEVDPLSPPSYVTITVDGVAYEKGYNESESDNHVAVYGNYYKTETVDCALLIDLGKVRAEDPADCINPIVQFAPETEEEQHTFSAYFAAEPVTTTPDFDAAVAKSSAEALAGKLNADGDAYRAASIPMGHLDSTSTATVMTATIPGITELRDGVCVWLENGVIASASGVTLNINSLGAKPIYNSLSGAIVTTTFAAASTYLFVYNSTRVTGGCWDMVYGYDANTTYTPAKLGFGYGTCTTAAATVAKTASISSYTLTAGGVVAIKFSNDVPANATLNINSKGAKAIYYKGAAITAGVIKAGDTVTMIYSTYYHVLSIDRDVDTLPPNPSDNDPYYVDTTASPGTSLAYARDDHVHAINSGAVEYLLDNQIAPYSDMLVLPSGAADGNAVVLRASKPGNVFLDYEIMSAHKHIAYFVIPLVQNPQDLNDFQVVSDASVSKAYATANGLGLQFNGIADGKLYSAEVVLPFDSVQGTGTLSVTDLALPSAQGVSF